MKSHSVVLFPSSPSHSKDFKLLQQNLKTVFKELSQIPYINSGGCGLLAHAIAKHLVTYPFLDKVQVKYCTREKLSKRESDLVACLIRGAVPNPERGSSWYNIHWEFGSHLVATFHYQGKEYVFDADSGLLPKLAYVRRPRRKCHLTKTGIPLGILKQMVALHCNWNPTFKRNKYEKDIEKIVSKHLNLKSLPSIVSTSHARPISTLC